MILKRLFDLTFTIPGVLVLSPVILVIALWIKLDSPGPILFRQMRVGRNGASFRMMKFRTMAETEGIGLQLTTGRNSRITRSGAFLRRHKLDEIPQLINVIKGEMSLVGPRPEVPEYVAVYPAETREIVLSVPPGITDYASIEFRNEASMLEASQDPEATYLDEILPAKLELNVQYVLERSLWLDLRLILKTIFALTTGTLAASR
ncbi:sugar transferase [Gemmatimonadota bacterium]